jgi:hypothetical protein
MTTFSRTILVRFAYISPQKPLTTGIAPIRTFSARKGDFINGHTLGYRIGGFATAVFVHFGAFEKLPTCALQE